MLTTIATVIAGLLGLGIMFIGFRGLVAPQDAAGFGIPGTRTEDPNFRAWLSVKAARDIGLGVILLVMIIAAGSVTLGWLLVATAVIPAGDMLIVLRNKGPKVAAYGIHGATAAVTAVAGVLLLVA